jgi:hypothetical protein
METVLELADVGTLDERIASRAAEALRSISRTRCPGCGGSEPSIVDSIVMAFADEYAASGEQTVVYTGDSHLDLLQSMVFTKVAIVRC